MQKRYFADIEHSKRLAHHFQDADWWWQEIPYPKVSIIVGKENKEKPPIMDKGRSSYYPAITTDMVLEKLPKKVVYKDLNHALLITKWDDYTV